MVDKIRELCKQNGTSIFKLEKQLGFGNGVIGRWDKAVPNYERLSAVASALGVSVSDLTGEADEKGIKKGPIQKDEADEMDAELVAIWNDSDETDRKLLLDMARAIKLRRENK